MFAKKWKISDSCMQLHEHWKFKCALMKSQKADITPSVQKEDRGRDVTKFSHGALIWQSQASQRCLTQRKHQRKILDVEQENEPYHNQEYGHEY